MDAAMLEKMTPKARTFFESVERLAAFDMETHEFCCNKHLTAFDSIQKQAVRFVAGVGQLTQVQVDYARIIVKGEVGHGRSRVSEDRRVGNDPSRMVEVRCVHADRVEVDGKSTLVRCETRFQGTALEMSECKSLCLEHRS